MLDVLSGFGVVAVVVAIGVVVGRLRLLGEGAETVLSRLVFFVCTPALLVRTLTGSDLGSVLGAPMVVAVVSSAAAALVFVTAARLATGLSWADTVVGALSASYVNAVNLGVPVTVYVLGDATWVVPMLLLQLVVLMPVSSLVLDAATAHHGVSWRLLLMPLRNPITVACGLGLVLAETGIGLPRFVADPVGLLASASIPLALIAFGISLASAPRVGADSHPGLVRLAVALKTVGQPLVAYAAGRALGLPPQAVLATTVVAALPTAQTVLVQATRYATAVGLARDTVLLSTVVCLPCVLVLRATLG